MNAPGQQYDTISIELERRLRVITNLRYMVWTGTSEHGEDIIFNIAPWGDPKNIYQHQIPMEDVVLLYLQKQLASRIIYRFIRGHLLDNTLGTYHHVNAI